LRINPIDMQDQRFRVTFRGFDPVEVDAYLQRIADELDRLLEERDALKAELDAERKARKTLDEALASGRTVQEGILERARGEAELTVSQAKLRADRILAEANEELLRLRREIQQIRERRAMSLVELGALAETLRGWVEQKTQSAAQGVLPLISEESGEEEQQQEEQEDSTVGEFTP
jgi:cell division initiation protein